MRQIGEYIIEKLRINKDTSTENGIIEKAVTEVMEKLNIKKEEFNFEYDNEIIIIKFKKKFSNFHNVLGDISKKIKENHLGLTFYVTGDNTLKEPEIYINRY